jgi:hypothetical protein
VRRLVSKPLLGTNAVIPIRVLLQDQELHPAVVDNRSPNFAALTWREQGPIEPMVPCFFPGNREIFKKNREAIEAAASSFAPIARAPSSSRTGILLKYITKVESATAPPAASPSARAGRAAAAPPRRPEQVEMRRARVFGDHPPRDKDRERQPENRERELDIEFTPAKVDNARCRPRSTR